MKPKYYFSYLINSKLHLSNITFYPIPSNKNNQTWLIFYITLQNKTRDYNKNSTFAKILKLCLHHTMANLQPS